MADIAVQHAVQSVLDELVEDGDEVGLQAAVVKDGALVADAQLCDWDHMCALVAEATPWWPPGTAFSYHARLCASCWVKRSGGRRVTAQIPSFAR
jgi:hypothetical protein